MDSSFKTGAVLGMGFINSHYLKERFSEKAVLKEGCIVTRGSTVPSSVLVSTHTRGLGTRSRSLNLASV